MEERKFGEEHPSSRFMRLAYSRYKRKIPEKLADQLESLIASSRQASSLSNAVELQYNWLVDHITIAAEVIAFEEVMQSSSVEMFFRFLEEWPKGIFRHEAERYLDERVWHYASSRQTLEAYEEYLKNIPFGKHKSEAKRQIAVLRAEREEQEAWRSARLADSEDAYTFYLKNWPKGKYAAQAIRRLEELRLQKAENKAWERALKIGSLASYNAYLRDWPSGAHSEEAKQQIERHKSLLTRISIYLMDRAEWLGAVQAGDENAYQEYLRKWPSGLYVGRVQKELELLRRQKHEEESWQKVKAASTEYMLRKFLKEWPHGRYSQEARHLLRRVTKDRLAWQRAKGEDTQEAYKRYLEEWPEGRFADEAKSRIEWLQNDYEAWQRAKGEDTQEAYKRYLEEWPEGKHAREAWNRALELAEEHAWQEALKANTVEAFNNFIKDFSGSPRVSAAFDKIKEIECEHAWHKALKTNSRSVLASFLTRCEGTSHFDEAVRRLRALERRQRFAKPLGVLGIIIVAGFLLLYNYRHILSSLLSLKAFLANEGSGVVANIRRFEHLIGLDKLAIFNIAFWLINSALLFVGVFYGVVFIKSRTLGESYMRSGNLSARKWIGSPLHYSGQLRTARRVALALMFALAVDVASALSIAYLAQPTFTALARLRQSITSLLPNGDFAIYKGKSRNVDLTGNWEMDVVIQKASYRPYVGLHLGYVLYIAQKGDSLIVEGTKASEAGRSIPFNQRVPIHMKGFVKDREVVLTYVLEGARRKSTGEFHLKIEDNGRRLLGTFSSEAANSSGTAVAYKIK